MPPMLNYHTIPVTPFQQNASLVWCDRTMDAAVIDPGGELEVLRAEVRASQRGVHGEATRWARRHAD